MHSVQFENSTLPVYLRGVVRAAQTNLGHARSRSAPKINTNYAQQTRLYGIVSPPSWPHYCCQHDNTKARLCFSRNFSKCAPPLLQNFSPFLGTPFAISSFVYACYARRFRNTRVISSDNAQFRADARHPDRLYILHANLAFQTPWRLVCAASR